VGLLGEGKGVGEEETKIKKEAKEITREGVN
jgi:hypothetical protein